MSGNPFLDRIAKRGTTGHGRNSEAKVAKSLAARLTPGSGNLRGAKGDMRHDARRKFLVEAKSTLAGSIVLDMGWLVKIQTEAINSGRYPALTISFITPEGNPRPKGSWVLIPLQDFKELTGDE